MHKKGTPDQKLGPTLGWNLQDVAVIFLDDYCNKYLLFAI